MEGFERKCPVTRLQLHRTTGSCWRVQGGAEPVSLGRELLQHSGWKMRVFGSGCRVVASSRVWTLLYLEGKSPVEFPNIDFGVQEKERSPE